MKYARNEKKTNVIDSFIKLVRDKNVPDLDNSQLYEQIDWCEEIAHCLESKSKNTLKRRKRKASSRLNLSYQQMNRLLDGLSLPEVEEHLEELMRTHEEILGRDRSDRGMFSPDQIVKQETLRAEIEVTQIEIERVNSTPMERLNFRDFMNLKSGHDEYSSLKLDDLKKRVGRDVSGLAKTEFGENSKLTERVLRWVLRGLDVDKAIRKVATDREVSANAAWSNSTKQ